MQSKRKHKTLSLKEKVEIITKLNSGQKMSKLAVEYGIGRSTIHDVKKNKQKIIDFVNTMDSEPGQRKTLRTGDYPKMENELYSWFMEMRTKKSQISGDILRAKAIEIYQKVALKDDFRASSGWLDNFKKRFGIRGITSGESIPRYEANIQPYVEINAQTPHFLPDHIFCQDEEPRTFVLRVEQPQKTVVPSTETRAASPDGINIKPEITTRDNTPEPQVDVYMPQVEEPTPSVSTTADSIQTRKRKKQQPTKPRGSDDFFELACDFLMKQSEASETDEIDDTVNLWAKKLRRIDCQQRLLAEKAISDIIFEAEMGTLHRNSVKINIE